MLIGCDVDECPAGILPTLVTPMLGIPPRFLVKFSQPHVYLDSGALLRACGMAFMLFSSLSLSTAESRTYRSTRALLPTQLLVHAFALFLFAVMPRTHVTS